MAILSKKLAELRERFSDQHGHEMAQVLDLGEALHRQSEQVNAALDDLLSSLHRDRAVIHGKLETLARCVGLLPPPAQLAAQAEARAIDAAIDGTEVSTAVLAPPSDDPLPRIFDRRPSSGASDAHVASARGASVAHQQPRQH